MLLRAIFDYEDEKGIYVICTDKRSRVIFCPTITNLDFLKKNVFYLKSVLVIYSTYNLHILIYVNQIFIE